MAKPNMKPGKSLKPHKIEYEDEDPNIHPEFAGALAKVGAKCQMPYHPLCTQK